MAVPVIAARARPRGHRWDGLRDQSAPSAKKNDFFGSA